MTLLAALTGRTRLDELEERLATTEARLDALVATGPPSPRWLGVWRSHTEYTVGSLTTHQGGLWLCCRPTSATPSTTDSGWTLIVKRGSYSGTSSE